MEIRKNRNGDFMTLRLHGRLDGYWADHLDREIDELVHSGTRQIELELSGLSYMSSAGIRILVKYRKTLQSIGGGFRIVQPSDFVRDLLVQTGLSGLFLEGPTAEKKAREESLAVRVVESESFIGKISTLREDATLSGRLLGNPLPLAAAGYRLEDAVSLPLTATVTGLGIGAFGKDREDCRERFGELLAVSGVAAYQPTDGAGTPDFMLKRGQFVPTLHALYALLWSGEYRRFVRFDSKSGEEAIGLSALMSMLVSPEEGASFGFVMIAETAGLLGATLKRSPLAQLSGSIFDHPEITGWLSFAAERVFKRALTLSAGVVCFQPEERLDPYLRPLGGAGPLRGHVHSVALSYRTLPEGPLDLNTTVTGLFETQDVLGVLHLLNDNRDISGAGESEFYRGALWVGPLQLLAEEKQ